MQKIGSFAEKLEKKCIDFDPLNPLRWGLNGL